MKDFFFKYRIPLLILLFFGVSFLIYTFFFSFASQQKSDLLNHQAQNSQEREKSKESLSEPISFSKDSPSEEKNFSSLSSQKISRELLPLTKKSLNLYRPVDPSTGKKDPFHGFNIEIDSLLSPEYSQSAQKYYLSAEHQNPKKIRGVYFVEQKQERSTLFHLPPEEDEISQIDISLPPHSAKYKMLTDHHLGYLSEVNEYDMGKSVIVYDIYTQEKKEIPVSDEGVRISSFFASPDGKKIIISEEHPPAEGKNFANANPFHHKTWVYSLTDTSVKWNIFDQQEDPLIRFPLFWSPEDDHIYFNSCDLETLNCNTGITKTSYTSNEHKKVLSLSEGEYTSQPVLSPNGRHIAFIHSNGVVILFDIQTGKKEKLIDIGDEKDIDRLFWAPDGMTLLFQMQQKVTLNTEVTNALQSTGIWRINLITKRLERIAPNLAFASGQVLSDFSAPPDGTGITFSLIDIFSENQKETYYLRFADMHLFSLGTNISEILKTEPL